MTGSHVALGPGGEFDRIRGIWRRIGDRAARLGDDCAVVQLGTERLAVSCDLAVEGTHFRLGWLSPEEIGWRATAAALSDLAAVAAEPAGVLVSLGVSGEWPEAWTADLMAGAADAAAGAGAAIWGGDLVRSESLVVDVAVIGRLAGPPASRRGATAGDELWVTGRLGAPHAALAAWLEGGEPDAAARLRFARPHPRVREGRWLQARGARAMIDLSDGLVADARHLAAASAVGVALDAGAVPVHPAATPAAALLGGEEYELLVALPAGSRLDAAFAEAFRLPLTRVGRATDGQGLIVLQDGQPLEIGEGYGHF